MEEYIFKEEDCTDSLIFFIPNYLPLHIANFYLTKLKKIDTKEWKSGFAFGRQIPRLQRWYADNNRYFYPNWHLKFDRWKSHEYEDWLAELQDNVNKKLHITFQKYLEEYSNFREFNANSTQINFYRNNNDMIPQHRDHLDTFGENPTIAILSLGSPRVMSFERIDPDSSKAKILKTEDEISKNFSINLTHGSMLIMAGNTQKYFSHGIPRSADTVDSRFSLTFRQHNNS
jgi:alkylated DNA repair dioxygenase AlkB